MRHMDTTTLTWPLTYKGVGLTIDTLPDGTYQGATEDGYDSPPYDDRQDALADATAHIDAIQGGLHAQHVD